MNRLTFLIAKLLVVLAAMIFVAAYLSDIVSLELPVSAVGTATLIALFVLVFWAEDRLKSRLVIHTVRMD